MFDESQELDSAARESNKKKDIILGLRLAPRTMVIVLENFTYRANNTKVAMQGFCGVEEGTPYTKAIHGCNDLAPNLAALTHSTDDKFPSTEYCLRNATDSVNKPLLRHRIRLVKSFEVCQSASLRRDDMNGGRYGSRIERRIALFVEIGRCHGEWWDRFTHRWHRSG